MPFSLERTAVLQLASFGVGVDEFAVNSAVVSSAAAMANPLHPPIIHFTTNKLRITRNQIEGQVNLGSVEFSNKIEQSLANTDPLKVRQNPQWQVTATNAWMASHIFADILHEVCW
jgi:hypothetical protein